MKMEIHEVEHCRSCPYADDGEMIGDGEWTCHAVETRKGHARHLSHGHPPAQPPKWCPLREAPILVQLVARKASADAS